MSLFFWLAVFLTITGCARHSGSDREQPMPPTRLEPPASAAPYGTFDVHKRHGLGGWSATPDQSAETPEKMP